MTVSDQHAIIKHDSTEIKTLIENRLRRAFELAENLPIAQRDELRKNINTAYQGSMELVQSLEASLETLKQADDYVQNATHIANEMKSQRDMVADELSTLINDLNRMDINNKTVQKFWGKAYEDAMENHNAAFWASLPYDLARTLGWNHMQADTLYQVITIDLDEYDFDEEDEDDWVDYEYGFTRADLIQARKDILKIVKRLRGD